MEEDLRSVLLAAPDVFALAGSRIAWGVRAQGWSRRPHVLLRRVSGVRSYVLAGADEHVASRVQVDVWAETYAEAEALAQAVIARLSGFSGRVGATDFQGVFLDAERDEFDAGATEPTRAHRLSFDFMVHHKGI